MFTQVRTYQINGMEVDCEYSRASNIDYYNHQVYPGHLVFAQLEEIYTLVDKM